MKELLSLLIVIGVIIGLVFCYHRGFEDGKAEGVKWERLDWEHAGHHAPYLHKTTQNWYRVEWADPKKLAESLKNSQ